MIGPGQSLLKISFFLAISFYVYMAGLEPSLFKPEVSWRFVPDSDREVGGPAPVTVMARSPGQADDCGEQPQPAGDHRDASHHQQDCAALSLAKTISKIIKKYFSLLASFSPGKPGPEWKSQKVPRLSQDMRVRRITMERRVVRKRRNTVHGLIFTSAADWLVSLPWL